MSIETIPIHKPTELPVAPRNDTMLTKEEMKDFLQGAVMDASIQASERANRVSYLESQKMLKVAQAEIEKFAAMYTKPDNQMTVIKMGDMPPIKDESGYVSPYMPEMLLHAGTADSRRDNRRKKRPMFLNGPKGCGKTTMARKLAEYLGLPFYHMALSYDMTKTSLFTWYPPSGGDPVDSPLMKGAKVGGVCLIDEVDNGNENSLVGINGIDNGEIYNPTTGENVKLHPDFIPICCANTVGTGADMVYTGRNRLDGAFLDRFWHIRIDYDKKLEKKLCPDDKIRHHLNGVRSKLLKIKAKEGISSRKMEVIYQACIIDGLKYQDCLDSMTMTWGKSVVQQSGVMENLPIWETPEDIAAKIEAAKMENARLKKAAGE